MCIFVNWKVVEITKRDEHSSFTTKVKNESWCKENFNSQQLWSFIDISKLIFNKRSNQMKLKTRYNGTKLIFFYILIRL